MSEPQLPGVGTPGLWMLNSQSLSGIPAPSDGSGQMVDGEGRGLTPGPESVTTRTGAGTSRFANSLGGYNGVNGRFGGDPDTEAGDVGTEEVDTGTQGFREATAGPDDEPSIDASRSTKRKGSMGGLSTGGGRGSSPAPARLLVHELAAAEGLDPELNRRAYEDWVFSRTKAINKARSKASVAAAQEPKRIKTNWDAVLEEMEWLAKDFMRERKEKLANAKRYATHVSKSNLSIEARQIAREKAAADEIRKKAKSMAQQVAAFWGKAQRVVATKVAIAVETKKKAVMDRHLELIVGQTERYSKMLASNLLQQQQQEEAAAAEEQARMAHEPARGGKPGKSVTWGVDPLPGGVMKEDGQVRVKKEEEVDESEEGAPGPASAPSKGTKRRRGESPGIKQEEGEEEEEEGDDEPVPKRRAPSARRAEAEQQRARKAAAQAARISAKVERAEAGDEEFTEDVDRESDDEDTLAQQEEEELQQMGGDKDKATKQELNELDEEADLPLEELLARYGYVVPGKDDVVEAEQQQEGEDGEEEQRQDGAGPSNAGAEAGAGDGEGGQEGEEGGGGESGEESPDYDILASDEDGEEGKEARAGGHHTPAVKPDPAGAMNNVAGQVQGSAGAKPVPKEEDEEEGNNKQLTMDSATRDAMAAQPTGHTLSTTSVTTKVPFLLKATLREYQQIGLDWLVTIYKKRLNGILADEMGLGKTIQAISLLAWLACEEGSWGPHLVVVPTSVMLNWEMEFKKFCPAFKLLTYYGSAKQRKEKRQGWSKPNAFHVCITSYTLVLQDAKMFRRKKWKYLILDEAHMIKNWKSQRWQTLLRFNSKRRLLITGTPLQNDLMELWSLMHFLMPDVFASHSQFRDWFCNPLTGMVEGSEAYNKQLVERLHGVLRPFLLRRMKSEVEKQMPPKHEHVVYCRLSKRQRMLYEEYMAASDTQSALASGNFMGIINVLMQLRKVCNHPDLFEGRPIVSAFDSPPLVVGVPSRVMVGCTSPPLDQELGWLVNQGIGLRQPSGALGVSPVVSVARGLLLSHPDAVAGHTAWDASEVERLQATYPVMMSACGAVMAAGGIPNLGAPLQQQAQGPSLVWAAPATQEDGSPLMRSAAAARLTCVGPQEMSPLPPPAPGASHPPNYSAGLQGVPDGVAGPGPQVASLRASYNSLVRSSQSLATVASSLAAQHARTAAWRTSRLRAAAATNAARCNAGAPLYGRDLLSLTSGLAHPFSRALNVHLVSVTDHTWVGPSAASYRVWAGDLAQDVPTGVATAATAEEAAASKPEALRYHPHKLPSVLVPLHFSSLVLDISETYSERAARVAPILREFMFVIPRARTTAPVVWCCHPDTSLVRKAAADVVLAQNEWFSRNAPVHLALTRQSMFFPDRKLIQFDCGKLQELDRLLRRLKQGGHRCLIFTQMAKMLDVLEVFLNIHGHTYMRLDGSTKPETRQILMQKFNTDPRNFCFILSTRSGGVGINLTGADTVIFYDSDWNPAMDAQAQDRCHRIGQTREVHIYRLVSENTIEENILRKSDQKRQLDWLAIQSGGFNTDFLQKMNLRDFLGGGAGAGGSGPSAAELKAALRSAEDEADAAAAAQAEQEAEQEMDEFTKEPPAGTGVKGEDDDKEEGDDEEEEGKEGAEAEKPSAAVVVKTEDGAVEGADPLAEGAGTDNALVADAAAQVAGGAKAQDVIARMESALKPVEKYAVRLLEELHPVDIEKEVEAAVASLGIEEGAEGGAFDAEEMAARREEAELAADEDSEEQVDDWDREAATAEYRALAEQARAMQEAQEAEAARLLEEQAAAAAAAAEAGYNPYGFDGGSGMDLGIPGLEPAPRGAWQQRALLYGGISGGMPRRQDSGAGGGYDQALWGFPGAAPGSDNGTALQAQGASFFDLTHGTAPGHPWAPQADRPLAVIAAKTLTAQYLALQSFMAQQHAQKVQAAIAAGQPPPLDQAPLSASPICILNQMPWADVAKVMRTAAEAMLPLHALEMSSVRVKARYMQLLAAHGAPLLNPMAVAQPGGGAQVAERPLLPLVAGVEERLVSLYASLPPQQVAAVQGALGLRGPAPAAAHPSSAALRAQLAAVAGELLPASMPGALDLTSNGPVTSGPHNPARAAAVSFALQWAEQAILSQTNAEGLVMALTLGAPAVAAAAAAAANGASHANGPTAPVTVS